MLCRVLEQAKPVVPGERQSARQAARQASDKGRVISYDETESNHQTEHHPLRTKPRPAAKKVASARPGADCCRGCTVLMG